MREDTLGDNTISTVDRNSETPLIRIAVSNVVGMFNDRMLGILSKSKTIDGTHRLGLVGGGAFLYEDQKSLRELGAFDFEGNDARFKIPLANLENFIDKETGYPKFLCEEDVMREVREELAKELVFDQTKPVVDKDKVELLRPSYMGNYLLYEGESLDSIQRGTNFRLINVFSLTGPEELIEEIKSSSVIYLITKKKLLNGYATGTAGNVELKAFIKETYDHIKDRGYEIKD
ncbi:MAG: hypothetical protein WCO66_05270 [Candidatus Absconditabacteria bacterium]